MQEQEELFIVAKMKDGRLHAILPIGERESDYVFHVPTIEECKRLGCVPPRVAVKKNGSATFRESDAWNDGGGV